MNPSIHNIHRRNGFSLIELMIVIAIVAILVAFLVVGGIAMIESTERGQTQTTLGQLAGVMTEYKVQSKGALPDPKDSDRIKQFIYDVMSFGEDNPAERMLRSINEVNWENRDRYEYGAGGSLPANAAALPTTLVDSWGTPIEYIDEDGQNDLFNTAAEQQPIRAQAYFGSAGPDGAWGSFNDGDTNQPDADAEDNLYSFQLND